MERTRQKYRRLAANCSERDWPSLYWTGRKRNQTRRRKVGGEYDDAMVDEACADVGRQGAKNNGDGHKVATMLGTMARYQTPIDHRQPWPTCHAFPSHCVPHDGTLVGFGTTVIRKVPATGRCLPLNGPSVLPYGIPSVVQSRPRESHVLSRYAPPAESAEATW